MSPPVRRHDNHFSISSPRKKKIPHRIANLECFFDAMTLDNSVFPLDISNARNSVSLPPDSKSMIQTDLVNNIWLLENKMGYPQTV